MPSVHSTAGMIGRKAGMMRLYDGSGRVRGVTVIEVDSNYVTQVRTPDRDGYAAVQVGHPGNRKRVNRPERGHLRQAGLDRVTLTHLLEFRLEEPGEYTLGQQLSAEQFEPGTFVDVTANSKGRGFQGGVKRYGFAGGPKTHGQSDRHRAPGSVGAGTTPARVWKGTKMAGHMGNRTTTVQNLLVVANDPERRLLFVEGSVPGPTGGLVTLQLGAKRPLRDFAPAVLPPVQEAEPEPEPEPEEEAAVAADELDVAEAVAEETPPQDADDLPPMEAEAGTDVAPEDAIPAADEAAEGDAPADEPAAEAEDETATGDEQSAGDESADEASESEDQR